MLKRDAVLAVSVAIIPNAEQDFLKLAYRLASYLEKLARKDFPWAGKYLSTCRRFIADPDFRERVMHYSDYVVSFSIMSVNYQMPKKLG